jgi:hypothetical protein
VKHAGKGGSFFLSFPPEYWAQYPMRNGFALFLLMVLCYVAAILRRPNRSAAPLE